MNQLQNLPKSITIAFSTGSLVILSYAITKFWFSFSRRNKRKNYPKDTVILHQFPKGLRAPSASPFPIKLETWLIF
jgi:hypothetical protein